MAYIPQQQDTYAFLTTASLASGSSYDSGIIALSPEYSQVQTHVRADQNGTIRIFWYSDAAGTDQIRTLTLPYSGSDGFQMFSAPAFAPYIKYTFENGASAQSDFYYDTKFLTKAINGQVLNMTAPIANGMVGNLTRNVNVGVNPSGSYDNNKVDGYAFLTTTPLTSGSTYDSGIMSLSPGWSQVQTHIRADQNGTLRVFWYSDAAGADNIRTLTLPYSSSDGFQMFGAPAFAPYIKYTFENGSVNQTDFYYDTKFTTKAINGQVLTMTAPIANGMTANLGRNVIAGRDDAGNWKNAGVDEEGHLFVHIDEPLTAFGELRTAEMTPLVQITHPYQINLDTLTTASNASGTITFDSTRRQIVVSSGAATNSSASLSTRKPIKYRNGQGTNVRFTCTFQSGVAGNTQYAGWGDDMGGLFFGYSGSEFGIMRRRSGSLDEFTPQTSWNVDNFSGTGGTSNPSGQLLDPTKGNVYQLQAQWLGYGAIAFYIESQLTGKFAPCHVIKYANQFDTPSLVNPTFPISFTSTNTTNNTAVSMSNASIAGFVEGKLVYNGINYSADGTTVAAANKNMITLQNPTTFNGFRNRTIALIKTLTLVTDGNNVITYNLVKNGTLTGGSFASVSANSPVQFDTTATYTAGTGRSAYKTILNKVDSATIDISSYEIFLNPGETISIIATGGANTGATVAISWLDDV